MSKSCGVKEARHLSPLPELVGAICLGLRLDIVVRVVCELPRWADKSHM